MVFMDDIRFRPEVTARFIDQRQDILNGSVSHVNSSMSKRCVPAVFRIYYNGSDRAVFQQQSMQRSLKPIATTFNQT